MAAKRQTVPLYDGELLVADELTGQSWRIKAEHHGHTMKVAGRIVDGEQATGLLIVRCSCGDAVRMAEGMAAKALRRDEGGASS